MKIFKDKLNLIKEISTTHKLAFVPTMGGLHSGHSYLIEKAKKTGCKVVVSIYVNPKQFNSRKDFISYPRNTKKDLNFLKRLKVNYVYLPKYKDIFSFKTKNRIFIDKFNNQLCGKFRKSHFKGVLNVVNRFLEIIKPKYLLLGKKDYQQLYLIDKHIKKIKLKTKVIPCKIIREKKGIPYSSRNFNLNNKQKIIASKIFKLIKSKKRSLKDKRVNNFLNVKKDIIKLGVRKIDYIEIINLKTLSHNLKKNNFRIFIAYYLGNVRLIDNI